MKNDNEKKLKELIIKWTSHSKWREDFLKWQEGRIWQEKYREKIINFLEKFIPELKRKKILDLGSGMGGFLVAMVKKGYDGIGLEPNSDYCKITKLRGKRYGLNVKTVKAPGEKIPFKNEVFDFIYCNDVLEHSESPEEILREGYRILKPASQMYVTVINRFGFRDPHYRLRFINWLPRAIVEKYLIWRKKTKENSFCQDRQKLSEMHYFTFSQFKKMANKIGFEVQDLKEYKIFHPELISTPRFQKVAKFFKIFLPIYFLARLFYLSSFTFLLKKK